MAFVICEPCIKCREMACLQVCPVEAFHEGPDRLVIDSQICIDCGACSPACPHKAIFDQDDVPQRWKSFVALNAVHSKAWPGIIDPIILKT